MKIVEINGGVVGSTGKIMFGIAEVAREHGYEVYCFSPVTSTNRYYNPSNEYTKIGSYHKRRISVFIDRITGYENCSTIFATIEFLKHLDNIKPDIIHIHTIHGSCINMVLLFNYIKKHKIPVVWTLHDCWAFTGHCPHFVRTNCTKWKYGCNKCLIYRKYPVSYLDNSYKMWNLKRKIFTGVDSMILITPSDWLNKLVHQSFLKIYPVRTLNNGIDLSVFKPQESLFRIEHGLEKKKIVLGVSYGWNEKKGLDVFVRLANDLPNTYKIVLVGCDEITKNKLPINILAISQTNNQSELVDIYSSANVFLNPTKEDTFPTVNIEAIACGLPVITTNVCGSPEMIDDTCGMVVDKNDYSGILDAVVYSCEKKPFKRSDCIAKASNYSKKEKFEEYIGLYDEILKNGGKSI